MISLQTTPRLSALFPQSAARENTDPREMLPQAKGAGQSQVPSRPPEVQGRDVSLADRLIFIPRRPYQRRTMHGRQVLITWIGKKSSINLRLLTPGCLALLLLIHIGSYFLGKSLEIIVRILHRGSVGSDSTIR
jgi:hypothetical protein